MKQALKPERNKLKSALATNILRSVMLIYLGIAVVITGTQIILSYKNEKQRLINEVEYIAKTFTPILSNSLWLFDEVQYQKSIEGIFEIHQDLNGVVLLNDRREMIHRVDNGKLFLEKLQNLVPTNKDFNSTTVLSDNIINISSLNYEEVGGKNQRVGYLIISTKPEALINRVQLTLLTTLASAFIKTIVLWIVFYWVINKKVAQPMNRLTRSMRNLNPEDNEDQGAYKNNTNKNNPNKYTPKDEISESISVFNRMEAALRIQQHRLLTHKEILELEVKNRTDSLQKEMEAKTKFLASMSHEIRTPMNGIIGITSLLKDTKLDREQTNFVKTINQSGESLIEIINGVLDHLKIESGNLELDPIDFNIEDTIETCANLFLLKQKEKNVKLDIFIDNDCPIYIHSDQIRIKQILINLLGNAFKFTKDGRIVIRVEKNQQEHDNSNCLKISVTDNGIGIDKLKQEQLFTPFFQAEQSTTRKFGGTGLGLAISKELVNLLGGVIGVESEAEKGSCFWFKIPITETTSTTNNSKIKLSNTNFIFVSDIQETTSYCRNIASDLGAQSRHYQNPQELLNEKKSGQSLKNVIIIDSNCLDMPLNQFEQQLNWSNTVVFVTGYLCDSKYQELRSKTNNFIDKPIFRSSLISIAKEIQTDADSIIEKPTDQYPDYSRIKVLVAEDNPVNQMVIQGMLKKFGIKPIIANNGAEAVDRFAEHSSEIELIFMDYEMPILDGKKASTKIRAIDSELHPQIYFVSALGSKEEITDSELLDIDGFISKPIKMCDLENILKASALDSGRPY